MNMRPTLADIIRTNNFVTDKNSTHSYCDHFYEKELARYRDKPVQIVEIGIDQGGSLMLWAEWFSQAKILGIDLQLRGNCAADCSRYSNIQLSLGNAYMYESIPHFPPMDILIDDGPHDLASQAWTVKNLATRIRPGGLFVIEDVADRAYLEQLKSVTPYHLQEYVEFVDLRGIKGRYDDMMFVIRIPGGSSTDDTIDGDVDINVPIGLGMDMMSERVSHLKGVIDFNDIKTIIDVGSAHGYESLNLARIFNRAKVYGFEPTPEHYQACIDLRSKTAAHIASRMTFINMALNDLDGPITFYPLDEQRSRGNNTGMASKLKLIDPGVFPHELSVQKEITVTATTLDTWCVSNNIKPDIIWMDAQGSELDILRGGVNVLDSVKVIMTEVGIKPYYHGHGLKPDIDAYLTSKGFKEMVSARKLGHEYEMDTIYLRV